MSQDASKVVLCGRRNTFATFSEDALHFSWQAQHLGHLWSHFTWQAQHFRRLVLRVFCESYCQRCAKWWQGAHSVAGVVFCDRWWKSTDASHETSILRSVRKKTRRRTSILKLQSVKFEDVSHEMFVVMLQHVSSRVAGFCGAVAVSMGEAAKPLFVECFKTGCHVVLRGRRGTLWHSNMFQDASKIQKSFCVAGVILLPRFQKMRCVAGAALWTPPMSFWVAGAALRTCRVARFFWHIIFLQVFGIPLFSFIPEDYRENCQRLKWKPAKAKPEPKAKAKARAVAKDGKKEEKPKPKPKAPPKPQAKMDDKAENSCPNKIFASPTWFALDWTQCAVDALNRFGSVFHLHYVMGMCFAFSKGWKKQKDLSGVASSCHILYARRIGLVEGYSLVACPYTLLLFGLSQRG